MTKERIADRAAGDRPAFIITPEMVAAGARAARQHTLGASLDDLVHDVYLAMFTELASMLPE